MTQFNELSWNRRILYRTDHKLKKLEAAQATAIYQLRNAVRKNQRLMGASHEGLSGKLINELQSMTQFIIGDMAAHFTEQNVFSKTCSLSLSKNIGKGA